MACHGFLIHDSCHKLAFYVKEYLKGGTFMETGILLESGTNELEILEFTIGNNYYGINVAKIKEILTYQTPTPVPNSHPCIEGILIGETFLALAPIFSTSDVFNPVSGLISATIFSKSRIMIRRLSNFTMRVFRCRCTIIKARNWEVSRSSRWFDWY